MPDCLFYAVQIQRKPMEYWKDMLENIPAECKDECRNYLLTIRSRGIEQLKAVRKMGFESVAQYKLSGR